MHTSATKILKQTMAHKWDGKEPRVSMAFSLLVGAQRKAHKITSLVLAFLFPPRRIIICPVNTSEFILLKLHSASRTSACNFYATLQI